MTSSARLPASVRRGAASCSLATRMQQEEEWIAATDEASGAQYWYNPKTLATTWEKPGPAVQPPAPMGPRMGQLLPVSEAQKKNAFKGGREGLMEAMNPINPGTIWYKEPSLIFFFGWQPVVALYAILFGFHNQYTGDFGPFVTFHDGSFDFSVGMCHQPATMCLKWICVQCSS